MYYVAAQEQQHLSLLQILSRGPPPPLLGLCPEAVVVLCSQLVGGSVLRMREEPLPPDLARDDAGVRRLQDVRMLLLGGRGGGQRGEQDQEDEEKDHSSLSSLQGRQFRFCLLIYGKLPRD